VRNLRSASRSNINLDNLSIALRALILSSSVTSVSKLLVKVFNAIIDGTIIAEVTRDIIIMKSLDRICIHQLTIIDCFVFRDIINESRINYLVEIR
jgi:hypothetical protein